MVALVRTALPDLGDEAPECARKLIRDELAKDPRATRRVYAALARKVWSLLVERRFDQEIRDWHVLLEGVKAKVKSSDEAAAERLGALADLLRESISLSEISPVREVAERPRARSILELLATTDRFTKRRLLLEKLGIGSSHLSNILTQLLAHDLIERRGNGKEAEFRITGRGRRSIGLESALQKAGTTTDLDLDRLFGNLPPVLGNELIRPVRQDLFGGVVRMAVNEVGWSNAHQAIQRDAVLAVGSRRISEYRRDPWNP